MRVRRAATLRSARSRSRFETWAWSPVIVLRVALVVTYLLHIGLATMAFIAGVPIFRLTAPEGYSDPWALFLGIGALAAAVGALDDRWRTLECWAALAVTAFAAGYVVPLYIVAFAAGDLNRQTVAIAVTFMLILPLSRFAWLAAQTGRRPAGGTDGP